MSELAQSTVGVTFPPQERRQPSFHRNTQNLSGISVTRICSPDVHPSFEDYFHGQMSHNHSAIDVPQVLGHEPMHRSLGYSLEPSWTPGSVWGTNGSVFPAGGMNCIQMGFQYQGNIYPKTEAVPYYAYDGVLAPPPPPPPSSSSPSLWKSPFILPMEQSSVDSTVSSTSVEEGVSFVDGDTSTVSLGTVLDIQQRIEEGTVQMDEERKARLQELEKFGREFRQQRIRQGLTQEQVGRELGQAYGSEFSQTTVSRFETLKLSFTNMEKMLPLMDGILDATLKSQSADKDWDGKCQVGGSVPPRGSTTLLVGKPRKKRTNIPKNVRAVLEKLFLTKPERPSKEIVEIAGQLEMDPTVVRVWFCNRRQRERRCSMAQVAPLGLN